jgi:hypothetical protein
MRMVGPALLVALLVSSVFAVPREDAAAQGPRFEAPVLLSAAGQSADVAMAGMLFKKAGIPATVAPLAKPADLQGRKTLVLVPGFSPKGLGSAGLDKAQEMARVQALLAAARASNLPVLVLHIGGKSRRGAQSDEFTRAVTAAAASLVVVEAGNADRFFTTVAAERRIPIEIVQRMADVTGAVARLFR